MNARIPFAALQPTYPQKDSTVFTSGNSQAVRIPKEFQLKTKQVKIIQQGDDLIVKPKYATMAELMAAAPPLTEKEREELHWAMTAARRDPLPPMEERDWGALQGIAKPKAAKAESTPCATRKTKAGK